MRRILAVVIGLTLAALAACGNDGNKAPSGAPVCHLDSECGPGVCDPFRGCVECRSSLQCSGDQRCSGGTCVASSSCRADRECSDSQRCDAGSGICVDCREDAHCGSGAICLNGACQPQSTCSDVHGCRPGTVCDLEQGRCTQCLGDDDCSTGNACVGGRCTARCLALAGCPVGTTCDPVLKLCLECATSSDCASTEHCRAGRCELDTCVAGSGTCDASGQVVQLCSAVGDRLVPLFCGSGASCSGVPGQAKCSDWVCTPGLTRCNAQGLLETCADDGLAVASTRDCAATDQICQLDACVDVLCEAGSARCDAGNVLHVCAADRLSESAQPCAVNQYCDAEAKSCKDRVCTPGVAVCSGDQHGVCNAEGSGLDDVVACKPDEACIAAACVKKSCDPGSTYCGQDGNVYSCAATGTPGPLLASCEADGENDGAGGASSADNFLHCEQVGNSASCQADPCLKGQPYCDGNQLKTCNAQGTGPVDAGSACGDDVCVNDGFTLAHCAKRVCTPSSRFCDDAGNVSQCSADGTSSYAWEYCGDNLYCDAIDAVCRYEQCEPGALGCNGSVAAKCAADGSGWLAGGTDCSATNKVCEAGACKAKVCEPSSYFCKSGSVDYCNQLGTGSTLIDACEASEYCYPGYSYCLLDQCTAGQPVCVDNTHVASCKADGSGPSGAGTACGANEICDAGACKDLVCQPQTTFCGGGHVQVCDSSGLGYGQQTYCFADEFCKTLSSTSAVCAKKVCTTGSKGCAGEVYATCDSLGSGFTDSPVDCSATNKICSLTGCAASAVDTLGDNSSTAFTSGNDFSGDVFHVAVARTLTKVEIDSNTDLTGQSLHWAIYESASAAGPYVPVFDVFAPGGPVGFQSSGTLNRPLKAGFYYLVGVQVPTPNLYWMPRHSSALGPTLSFAEPAGALTYYVADGTLPPSVSGATPGTFLFYMRLTTTK